MDLSRPADNKINSQMKIASSNDKPATTKTRHATERIKLYLNITPKQYEGAHLLGNFKQQSKWNQKQKAELRDLRVDVLPASLFRNKRVIDVGCGQGKVAVEIALRFFPLKMVALDIDGYLLSRAAKLVEKLVERSEIIATRQQTLLKQVQELPKYFQNLYFKNKQKTSCMNEKNIQLIAEGEQFTSNFPNNFYIFNENFLNLKTDQKYDTVVLMNTSKWVHLAMGDQGLTTLFEKCSDILEVGGILVLEYPLFESYRKKKSMNSLYRENLEGKITIDPLTFPSLLQYMHLRLLEEFKSNDGRSFKHPIALFEKVEAKSQ